MPKDSIRYRKIFAGIIAFLLLIGCSNYEAVAQLQSAFRGTPTADCAPIRVSFEDLSTGNPTSWKWDLGNGTISTLKNPSTTYFNPGTYTVKLTVYNSTDSSSTTKVNYITVYGNPTVDFDATPKTGCYPLNVSFADRSIAGSGNIANWQWDFGDGNISNLQNPTHVYLNTGAYNVSLTVKNTNGCSSTLNKFNLIKIGQGAKADFANTIPPACDVPAVVNFTNMSTGTNIVSYLWNFGDGQTSSLPNPSHTYSRAGIYTVKLIARNASGCTDTITKQDLLSIGIYKAGFVIPANICIKDKINITNTSFPTASLTKCRWNFGDGTTDTLFNPVKSYATTGVFNVKLVAEFGSCSDSIIKIVNVLSRPTASFTGNNLFACKPPLAASFTNTSVDGTVVKWDFGDGGSSTLENPVHTYNTPGNFSVTLIVKNANGCTDTIVKSSFVNVTPLPKITKINPLPLEGCIPYPVHFQPIVATLDPIVSYQWNFGDGTTSTNSNPIYTYNVEGIYNVRLKITTTGGCTDTFQNSVTVGEKPTAQFSATPRQACAMTEISFSDSSTTGINQWLWDFGDGAISRLQNPNHFYGDTGFFTPTLIVWRNGCSDTIIKNDYMYIRAPIAGYIDSFVCNNQFQHFFRDRSIGGLYWKYWFGDGDSTDEVNPTHLYKDTGRYLVTQLVKDDFCQYTVSSTVLVLNEKAGFNVVDSVGCKSTLKKFSATSNAWNIKNYQWDFGDGVTASDLVSPTINHIYNVSDIYNVKLIIKDINGCTDVVTKPVPVIRYGPKADFGPFQNICIHTSANFQDLSQAGINPIVQWIWDFGDGTGAQTYNNGLPFPHTYDLGGLYTVKLVVVDASGCSDTIIKSGNVLVNDPRADFSSADTLKCRNSLVSFTQSLSGNNLAPLKWYFGDGDSTFGSNPQHLYIDTGTYNVKLILNDNIGCTDTVFKP